MRVRCLVKLAALVVLACLSAPPAPLSPAWAEAPLRAGVLADAAPFVLRDAHGQLTGFTVELFRLIAARIDRPIDFETAAEPALYAGLAGGKYDLLPGPIAATPDRAADMLLTEGYLWSEFQFGSRPGEVVRTLADLHGKRLAVRGGSAYAEWAEHNGARYGFSVVVAASGLGAAELVVRGRADVSLIGSPLQDYAAVHDTSYVAGLSLPETRTHVSAAVRRADGELREELEDALRCLKMNGTLARLSRQWFGSDPGPEDLENLVVPGYGVPGLAGYDPKPHKTRC